MSNQCLKVWETVESHNGFDINPSGYLVLATIGVLAIAWFSPPLSSRELPQLQRQPLIAQKQQAVESGIRRKQTVSVPAIARQVTVRILNKSGMGSGVIIQHQGQTYTVVTCAHVLGDSEEDRYTVLTLDGRTHSGRWLRSTQFLDADLALVQFTSKQAYQVAAIADSQALTIGDATYAAGFPNWQWINSNDVAETRDWGTKAFRLTNGKVAMLPSKSLKEGYRLGYTNEVSQGMSGGPVLDGYGQLIGINGLLKYPLEGTNSFIFADGTIPSEKLSRQMEGLSWAIPSARFRQVIK